MICKNCEHNFEGDFCNNCGQNSKVGKVDFSYLLDEIQNSIFQVNRGILFTILELTIRPGHSIREFLAGKRKQHFKPLAFVLLLSTVYALTAYLTASGTFLGNVIAGMVESSNNNGTEPTMPLKTLKWFADNNAYATLLLLPFFSLASYLAFIKSKYNYFEHLILNFYITGQQMLIYMVFNFIYIEGYLMQTIPILLGIAYTFWTFNQFFEGQKSSTKIFLTVLTYIYMTIQFISIMALVWFMKS